MFNFTYNPTHKDIWENFDDPSKHMIGERGRPVDCNFPKSRAVIFLHFPQMIPLTLFRSDKMYHIWAIVSVSWILISVRKKNSLCTLIFISRCTYFSRRHLRFWVLKRCMHVLNVIYVSTTIDLSRTTLCLKSVRLLMFEIGQVN